MEHPNRILSVAPMMDWTDKYDRYFLRTISRHVLLYTEMVNANAIVYGDAERHLAFFVDEHPIAVQLGGSDPKLLAQASKICEQFNYDEINLNCGCPSDRVQSGQFGAVLMQTPELVADCVKAMQDSVSVPVTVKHRIGIDNQDDYDFVRRFIDTVATHGGCTSFTVHARKAILQGLSPKENRTIPPLIYDTVYRLKRDYPHLQFILNGGVQNMSDVQTHLPHVDGVMIGRSAYNTPYDCLATADKDIYNNNDPIASRDDVVLGMIPFVQNCLANGTPLRFISRHMIGLYHAQVGGKLWRRHISEHAYADNADETVILDALKLVQAEREKIN